MAAILRQEAHGTQWHTWIEINPRMATMLITDNKITEPEALVIQAQQVEAHALDDVQTAGITLDDFKGVLRDAVTYIKRADFTGAKWNAWLATLTWYEVYAVRFFLAALALKLVAREDVQIDNFTELEVLTHLRTFILATPNKILAKIVFGD